MSDTHAACMNFVNALEKIPGIIAQFEERTARLKADVPQLEAIVAKQWGKENELKQLKSELAALDRKITATLAPKHDDTIDDGKSSQPPHSNNRQTTYPRNPQNSKRINLPSLPSRGINTVDILECENKVYIGQLSYIDFIMQYFV